MGVGIVQHAHNSKLVRGQYVAPPAWRSQGFVSALSIQRLHLRIFQYPAT